MGTAESLPLILNDGTNSYIYGAGGLPVEQINTSTGTVLYLHHDQQGSTRLLTSSTGAKEASFTYDAYGNILGSTGTSTTPVGYDAQYTNSDTGLIYLRARVYDPATGQFMGVDPKVAETSAPYGYAKDDPLALGDPSGECTAVAAALPHFSGGRPWCEAQMAKIRQVAGDAHQLYGKLKKAWNDKVRTVREAKEWHQRRVEEIKQIDEEADGLANIIKDYESAKCPAIIGVPVPAAARREALPVAVTWPTWEYIY